MGDGLAGDVPESMAEARRRWLGRDRGAELDALIAKVRADPGASETDLAVLTGERGRADLIAAGGLSAGLWPEVRRSLPSDPAPRRDLDRLVFHDLQHDQVSAVCGVEADGSGLVLVADGLLGLVVYLARMLPYCSHGAGSGVRGFLRTAGTVVANARGRSSRRQQVVEALTRYHLLQQQCFGVAGKLSVKVSRHERDQSDIYAQCAMWFVLAHETGHFALGHPPAALGVVDGEELPLVSDEHHLELEADACGVAAVLASLAGVPDDAARSVAAIGVAIALLAVELTEEALFVRRPRTHPPTRDRWERVGAVIGDEASAAADLVGLLRAPVMACARPQDALSPERWSATWRDREVVIWDANRDAVAYTPALDQAVNGALPEPDRLVALGPAAPVIARTALGVSDAASLRLALDGWGLAGPAVADLLDPRSGVTFSGLRSRLLGSSGFAAVEGNEARLLASCYVTRVLAPTIADLRA